jgi:hypothetical protein
MGGVVAGIALATSDISFGLFDSLLGAIGIDNPFIQSAVTILGVAVMFALAMWVKGMVSSAVLKAVFGFLGLMIGTYLVIKVIKMFISLITTGTIESEMPGGE